MRLLFILIAFVIAVGAGLAAFTLSKDKNDAQPEVMVTPLEPVVPVQETRILVARQDVPVGKSIDANDIDKQQWPSTMVHPEFITEGNEAALIGRVTRTPFKKGEPLASSRLANPNDPGFLAAQLGEGMRAVTIPIDAISGINGFVYPGDRVDVLVRHNIALQKDFEDGSTPPAEETGPATPRETVQRLPLENKYNVPLLMADSKRVARPSLNVTEVLVANAKVLAVGAQSYQYENTNAQPTNVTLEVSELQAAKLRHADAGSISLALRSLKDSDDRRYARPVADADMSRLVPPSYFPYMYDEGDYKTDVVKLEEVDYDAVESEEEVKKSTDSITVIRGVEKEIVGVAQ